MAEEKDSKMVTYPQDERSKSILLLLDGKRKEGDLCDVKLILGEGITVYAHKALLGAISPYFESMFMSTFREATSSVVDLSYTTDKSDILMSVIDSFYGKCFEIDASNVCDVMNLAAMFLLDDLKKVCEDVMETVISLTNCVELFIMAINFELKTLMEKLIPIIKARFHDYLIFEDDIYALPVEHMSIFLSYVDTEKVTDKYLFLDLLLNWFSFDISNERAQFLADALDNFSFKCTCPMYEKLHHKVYNIVAQLKSEADEDDMDINSEVKSRLQSLFESLKPVDFDVYVEKKKQKISEPFFQPTPEHLIPLLSEIEPPFEPSGHHDNMEKGDDVQVNLSDEVRGIDTGLKSNDDDKEDKRAMVNLNLNTVKSKEGTKENEGNVDDVPAMIGVSVKDDIEGDKRVIVNLSLKIDRSNPEQPKVTYSGFNEMDDREIALIQMGGSGKENFQLCPQFKDTEQQMVSMDSSSDSDNRVSSLKSSTLKRDTVSPQPSTSKNSGETNVSSVPLIVEVNSVEMDKSDVKEKVGKKKGKKKPRNKGKGFMARNIFKADTFLGTEEGAVIVLAPSSHYVKSAVHLNGGGIWHGPTVKVEKEGTLQISCYIPGRKLWMDMGSIDLKGIPLKAMTSSYTRFFGAWGEMPDLDDEFDEYEMMMMMPKLPRRLQRRMLEMFPRNLPPSMIRRMMEEFHDEGDMPSHEHMRRMRDHLIRSRMHHRPSLHHSRVPNPLNPDQVNKWRFTYFQRKIFLFHQDFCESVFCYDLESQKWSTSSIDIRYERHGHDFEVADGIEPVVHGRKLYAVVRIVSYYIVDPYRMGRDKNEEQRVDTSYKIFCYKGEQNWNFFMKTQTCWTTVPNMEMKSPEDFLMLTRESGFFKTIIHNQDIHSIVIFQFRAESSKLRTVHALNNADVVYIDRKHTGSRSNVPSHFSYIRLPTLVLQKPHSSENKLLCFMDDEFQTKVLYDCGNQRHENDKFVRMSDSEHEESSPILEAQISYPNCTKLIISDGEYFWLLSGEKNDTSRLQQGSVKINREQKKREAVFQDHPPPPFKVFTLAAAAKVDTVYLESLQTARYFHV
ncbi:hypothetical protein CHS0354_040930 [Potamilus streckersoni]|uniref:BTB domain-containing protein n=1 Tax=Potamilus streckersoni TaxID=2493646 RepID=A0AAE0VXV6_9BIVA|nr:hypothetical protein CHS0354_040930 [Potamilus streckersoni]